MIILKNLLRRLEIEKGNTKTEENNVVEKEKVCSWSKDGICTLHNTKCQECFKEV